MSVIQIKTRLVPSIGLLHHIVLRCIFDEHATLDEWRVLEDGINSWEKKIDITPDEVWEIRRIKNALIANQKGFFDRAKELFREHNVDYMKFYKAGIPNINPDRKFWNKS